MILSNKILWTCVLYLFPFRSNAHASCLLWSVGCMTGTPRSPTWDQLNGRYTCGRPTGLGHPSFLHAFPSLRFWPWDMNKLSRFTKKAYMNLLQLECELRFGRNPKPQKEIQLKWPSFALFRVKTLWKQHFHALNEKSWITYVWIMFAVR